MKTKTSPFVLDEPSKVFDLASHFGGRRLRSPLRVEQYEVYKFPTREQMWKFSAAMQAFTTGDDCVLELTGRAESVTVEYKQQVGV